MTKIQNLFLFFFLLYPHYVMASAEEKIIAGISFNGENKKFFVEYHDHETEYSKIEKSKNPSLHVEETPYNFYYNNNTKNSFSYSGYRNVEGFKNNKRKNDITFASIAVATGLVVVGLGAVTINAIIDAIDN